ncbi:pilus assembly protein [Dyella tabacisoli]|uniref:pilus assembly protein n=1 Tax=Dyella tabacisoli TaxID=2282381 RepID=UPI0013B36CD4|nr:PilC/PilY family type IV pilus protein [Dyella tabacisoli]
MSTKVSCNNNIGGGYYKYTGSKDSLPLDGYGALTATALSNLYLQSNWVFVPLGTDAEKQNYANWYSYYSTRLMSAITSMSHVFSSLNGNVRVAWQGLNANHLRNDTAIYKFVDDAATNHVRTRFYDWLFNLEAPGGTPSRIATMRVGEYFTNRRGAVDSNPYWDRDAGKELVCRQNFHILMTDGLWTRDLSLQPSGHDRSVIPSLPDGLQGFSTSDRESSIFWNEPDNNIGTMADIAFHYWARDLQAGLSSDKNSLFADEANRRKVPPYFPDQSTTLFGKPLASGADPRSNKEVYWNPANDPATWPHLVQYMVGFGVFGTLPNNEVTYNGLRKGSLSWPVPIPWDGADGRKIDDMWHAALNSRGKYISANNPTALVDAMTRIISSIASRNTTTVAGSLSSAVLGPASVIYQAGFDTTTWKGSVQARPVDAAGMVSSGVLWDAAALLDARAAGNDTRVILTSTGSGPGKGATFTWATAGAALKAADPDFDANGRGADHVAWLRGNRSKEGALFRPRSSVLGPVINAQALYVGSPASGYRDNWPAGSPEAQAASHGASYEQFRADKSKRAPTIYVAANDGMLHAFDATTASTDPVLVDVAPSPGKERWAYVPYSVYGRLSQWSSLADFNFMPTVDGTPVSRDVYGATGHASASWRTMLVAGLRLGGRGVYALDITDVDAAVGPVERAMWEFNNTSPGGENLGYTYGRPNIGRLANGKWVVLVSSGYFPEGSTAPAASHNFSSLFVLDALTGALIREIKTPAQVPGVGNVVSYGLTTPVLGDYNGDQIDDVAFAGDLQGNIWRFDFTDASPANWKVELLFRPKHPGDRPVTVMPRLFPTPLSAGFTVVFGTGKYLGRSDNVISAQTKTQAVYGIRDVGRAGQPVVIEGDIATPLVQQSMIEVNGIRGLTDNPMPATSTGGMAVRGWYFNLDIDGAKGERMVVDATALFDSNRAVINTLIPQGDDPCEPELKGAVIVIDIATGSAGASMSFGDIPGWPADYEQAGGRVSNPPTGGYLPVATGIGGGRLYVPGVKMEKDPSKAFSFGDAIWRRRSWRVLNNDQ